MGTATAIPSPYWTRNSRLMRRALASSISLRCCWKSDKSTVGRSRRYPAFWLRVVDGAHRGLLAGFRPSRLLDRQSVTPMWFAFFSIFYEVEAVSQSFEKCAVACRPSGCTRRLAFRPRVSEGPPDFSRTRILRNPLWVCRPQDEGAVFDVTRVCGVQSGSVKIVLICSVRSMKIVDAAKFSHGMRSWYFPLLERPL